SPPKRRARRRGCSAMSSWPKILPTSRNPLRRSLKSDRLQRHNLKRWPSGPRLRVDCLFRDLSRAGNEQRGENAFDIVRSVDLLGAQELVGNVAQPPGERACHAGAIDAGAPWRKSAWPGTP